ncbi:Transposase IS66 central domain-containing protein [Myxococcus xanthus]|nr:MULTISPECIES: transposase [Myxococcus]NOJ54655.1 transposase [Myxococcus xanthus]QPM81385.1 transposase [Myxococcus xanthus]QVW70443.1 transposase [Myxococcus xanthus DZ2]QZZ49310.1 hypothetical protein MyxoNM_08870 [Myxococcus xanthus]UEO03429.1 IS66 family transposase [Myxococcus xanthus DZ2]
MVRRESHSDFGQLPVRGERAELADVVAGASGGAEHLGQARLLAPSVDVEECAPAVRVEAQAREADVVRTAVRQLHSAPVLAQLRTWLEAQAPRHPPKSPLGQAISYALTQWEALTRFVENERLPLDSNGSEAAA